MKKENSHLFIHYERDAAGLVKRTHISGRIVQSQCRQFDVGEVLRGWPEDIVYWNRKQGAAYGIAPRSKQAEKFMCMRDSVALPSEGI